MTSILRLVGTLLVLLYLAACGDVSGFSHNSPFAAQSSTPIPTMTREEWGQHMSQMLPEEIWNGDSFVWPRGMVVVFSRRIEGGWEHYPFRMGYNGPYLLNEERTARVEFETRGCTAQVLNTSTFVTCEGTLLFSVQFEELELQHYDDTYMTVSPYSSGHKTNVDSHASIQLGQDLSPVQDDQSAAIAQPEPVPAHYPDEHWREWEAKTFQLPNGAVYTFTWDSAQVRPQGDAAAGNCAARYTVGKEIWSCNGADLFIIGTETFYDQQEHAEFMQGKAPLPTRIRILNRVANQ
jgi:hypothetical protein